MVKYDCIDKLPRWKRADNYLGEDFSDYFVGPGRHRNSGHLQESNFDEALKRLGGENEEEGVITAHSTHWLVGWVEVILVHKNSTDAALKLLDILNEIDNYPVLNDSDYSDRCTESARVDWLSYGFDDLKKALGLDPEKDYTEEEKLSYLDQVDADYEEDCGTCFSTRDTIEG